MNKVLLGKDELIIPWLLTEASGDFRRVPSPDAENRMSGGVKGP